MNYPAPFGLAHLLATVDTGKRKAGLAVWHVVGGEARLVGARLVLSKTAAPRDRRRRVSWSPGHMAGALILARASLAPDLVGLPTVWVCERPKKYQNKRRNHADLDALLQVIDALTASGAGRVVRRNVHAWKGNVPKAAHHRRTLDALRPTEADLVAHLVDPLALATYQDDIADAIALGLFETGRVGRGGVRR